MKKMCLTLHNLHMIAQKRLPIHGSMMRITFAGQTRPLSSLAIPVPANPSHRGLAADRR